MESIFMKFIWACKWVSVSPKAGEALYLNNAPGLLIACHDNHDKHDNYDNHDNHAWWRLGKPFIWIRHLLTIFTLIIMIIMIMAEKTFIWIDRCLGAPTSPFGCWGRVIQAVLLFGCWNFHNVDLKLNKPFVAGDDFHLNHDDITGVWS